jgi:superfamily II DNA or RNA helicase
MLWSITNPVRLGMADLTIQKLDEVRIRVISTSGTVRSELKEAFSYFVPNFRHMPKYKFGIWDGRISLYDLRNSSTYLGLLTKVLQFADNRGLSVEIDQSEFSPHESIDFESFMASFKAKHELRDYQKEVLKIASTESKALFLSATGSGKSLSLYALIRMISRPTLLIVPSIQLVGQMYGDFKDYSSVDPTFDVEAMVQQIHGGQTKEVSKPIVISTWQSIYKMPPEYFANFEVVIADEAHEDKSEKLRQLIEKCKNSKYRYGFTGTLDGTLTNEMILRGLFGDVHQVSRTSDLIDKGVLADLRLKQVILQYPERVRRENARKVYQEEVEYLLSSEARMNFLTKLSLKCPGNSLILFQRVEGHGKKIYEQLKLENESLGLNRKIFLVHGGISKDKRLEIVNVAEQGDGVIIVASLGTFARGINIRNLENLIFAFGLKAKITTLQGIGRGLRIGRSNKVTVFDICDDLSWKTWQNYSLRHAIERMKIYQEERFNYSIVKVALEGPETKAKGN